MINTGFVLLHRKITENPVWQNPELAHLLTHLILIANHERKRILRKGQEEWIERGQVKTGQYLLAMQTGIPRGNIHHYLLILVRSGIVSIKASNKYSIITLIKYEDYQKKRNDASSKASSQLVASYAPASTNNNVTMKQTLSPQATEGAKVFNSQEYIQKLLNDPKRHIQIIGLYYQFKELEFPGIDGARFSVTRDLKGARALNEYPNDRILQIMIFLQKKVNANNLEKWTLETVSKYINEKI